jgi:hypothetical protein
VESRGKRGRLAGKKVVAFTFVKFESTAEFSWRK